MAASSSRSPIAGIDPASWSVRILPLPKRFSRGLATGFCGGLPVGLVEAARGSRIGCWWPGDGAQLLTIEGFKDAAVGTAGGDLIPGHWTKGAAGAKGAVVWRRTGTDDRLEAVNLHTKEYEQSWATAAANGVAVGVGTPIGKPGSRKPDVGLVWTNGDQPATVSTDGSVLLLATDGTRLAGSVRGRAALWLSAAAPQIDLAPPKTFASEVRALTESCAAGVAFQGMCARAALWRGAEAAFVDLTPAGFKTGQIFGAAGHYQVGAVRKKDTTRNGSTGSDDRAVIWHGSAAEWFDLNSLLPADTYNASTARAIEIRGQDVYICGEASRYEVSGTGSNESHVVPVAHPVVWSARLI